MACDRAGYIESWQSNFKSHNDTAQNWSIIMMLKQKGLLKYWLLIDF